MDKRTYLQALTGEHPKPAEIPPNSDAEFRDPIPTVEAEVGDIPDEPLPMEFEGNPWIHVGPKKKNKQLASPRKGDAGRHGPAPKRKISSPPRNNDQKRSKYELKKKTISPTVQNPKKRKGTYSPPRNVGWKRLRTEPEKPATKVINRLIYC